MSSEKQGLRKSAAGPASETQKVRGGTAQSTDSWKAFEKVHRAFADALKEVWLPEQSRQRLAEAYSKYVQAVLEMSGPEDAKKVEDAYKSYAEIQQETWLTEAIKKRMGKALGSYVTGIKEAWTQVDPEQVDANLLFALGQSLLSVAQYSVAAQSSFE